jgi:hypothetical protein
VPPPWMAVQQVQAPQPQVLVRVLQRAQVLELPEYQQD